MYVQIINYVYIQVMHQMPNRKVVKAQRFWPNFNTFCITWFSFAIWTMEYQNFWKSAARERDISILISVYKFNIFNFDLTNKSVINNTNELIMPLWRTRDRPLGPPSITQKVFMHRLLLSPLTKQGPQSNRARRRHYLARKVETFWWRWRRN